MARLLRILVPILVAFGATRVWTLWNDHRHVSAIVFACILGAVLVGLAGFMPWYLRRAVERRREAASGR